MPGGRVLASEAARDAVKKFQQIVNGPLLEQINALNRVGSDLSDPNNWDGRLATEFRSKWPESHRAMIKMKDALEELRGQVDQITQNIFSAGGS
jgi:uncharacterized protein YukE